MWVGPANNWLRTGRKLYNTRLWPFGFYGTVLSLENLVSFRFLGLSKDSVESLFGNATLLYAAE